MAKFELIMRHIRDDGDTEQYVMAQYPYDSAEDPEVIAEKVSALMHETADELVLIAKGTGKHAQ